MAKLLNHRGEPLLDADDFELFNGQDAFDEMFGACVLRGTVPIDNERGEGASRC